MPRAADGTPMHSFSRAKHHDSVMAERKAKPAPAGDDKQKPKPDGSQNGDEPQDIESIVKQHGPAHEMEYKHDKATNKHHVKSKHGEANVEHESEHDTPEDAREEMYKATGGTDENPDEQLGEETGEIMPMMEEESSGHIPGMR